MGRLAAAGCALCLLAGAVCATPLEFSLHRVEGVIDGMGLVRIVDGETIAARSQPHRPLW